MARSTGGVGSKHTEDADAKYLYGTPTEVANRLHRGDAGPATESHFSQIRPSEKSGKSGIADRTGKVVRNGKLGGDLRHSGD